MLHETIGALKRLEAALPEPAALPWADRAFSERFATRVDYTALFGHPPEKVQADALIGQLDLRPGAAIVDLCCGTGPHAVELALRGFRVVGVDIGPGAVALGRRRAAAARARVRFIEADLADPALPERLAAEAPDAAFLIRGQADNFAPAALRTLIARAAGWLRPGGRLLLEFSDIDSADRQAGRSWAVSDGATSIWADHDTLVLSEATWHEAARLRLTRYFVIHPDGRLDRYASSVQYFACGDLREWLRGAGFAGVRFRPGDGAWTRVVATL